MELFTCRLSTVVQPDSNANLIFSIDEGLYSKKKGEVIYNGSATGVDLNRFDKNKKQLWRNEIRAEFNIPNDAFVFGFIGRLVPQKGIDELIDSYLKLKKQNVYLMLVGHKDELENLEQVNLEQAIEDDHVIFTGSVLDPERYHAAFDVFVLPSYREGFGMVILEAAAMEIPSIVTNIKGPTDFVKDDYNGFVCEVMSKESLLKTMKKVMELPIDQFHKISRTAYDVAKSDFDAEEFKKRLLENRNKLLKLINKE